MVARSSRRHLTLSARPVNSLDRESGASVGRRRTAEGAPADARCLHLRCGAHPDRPLRRRARQGAHRRSRRGADPGAGRAQRARPTGRGSTRCSSAAPIRPARTTAMSRAWRCCSPACRTRVPGVTVNRLCASGLNAVGDAARAIRSGEIDFAIAGGVESMTRAPFVMGKADEAFSRAAEIYDTTIGWRFINPVLKAQYGVDSMAGDRRERRRGISGRARRPGRFRAALATARRQGGGRRLFRRGDRAGRGAGRQGRPDRGRQGRASAARHHAGEPRQAQADRAQSAAPSPPAMPRASTTAPPRMILASEEAVKAHG